MTNSGTSASSLKNPDFFRLSIRTKILTAYGVLILLFLLILLTGFSQFKSIAAKLNMIQFVFSPLSSRISSISSLYHLDSDFNYEEVEKNFKNPMFVNAINHLNPRIFTQTLQRAMGDAERTLREHRLDAKLIPLNRLHEIIAQLELQHGEYVDILSRIIKHLQDSDPRRAELLKDALLEKKRDVKSHLSFLSSRVQDLTKKTIQDIVKKERMAVFIIAGLSLITFFVAIVIGLIAMWSLNPLRKLKETAKDIAAGNLEKRAPVISQDEIGDLAREFNTMAESIQERDIAIRHQQKRLVESQKMAVIGQMASKISHEIRNPLNALSLNVELLDENLSDAKSKAMIKAIANEIDRLNRITLQYLDMARTPKGDFTQTSLKDILNHLKTLLAEECRHQGIRFDVEIDESLPLLNVNATSLEQALLNLCRNAIEAVGKRGTWGIRSFAESGRVVIEVWDKGVGIPESDLSNIFEPFYTTKTKGTGLGLAITAEAVREMNGSLTCKSAPGEGATFTIQFPISS